MSYDRQLDQVCPHTIASEAIFPDPDSRTVRPLRPIAAQGSVAVKLNGDIPVPASGVMQEGSVLSARQGPFVINAGVNDRVILRVAGLPDQTLIAPSTSGITAARLANHLNPLVSGVIFFDSNGRLGLRTAVKGKAAAFLTGTGSTLLASIGIPVNREYRGLNIVPGWSLVRDPNSLSVRPLRNIVFNEALRGFRDFVEIDYSTESQECRRCGGTKMENDWRYGSNGEVVQVVDEALLIQEVQKITFTLKGSNQFHTWYGTSLLDAVGKKITPGNVLQNLIVSDIQTAFRRWQSIKRQQEEVVGQEVSDREYPFALVSVVLNQSTVDPTVMFVKVNIKNRSNDEVILDRGIRFPLPLDFVQANSAMGAIRQSLSDYVLNG